MHPHTLFRHCPRCGSPRFAPHNIKASHCPDCHFILYYNVAAAVAALITDPDNRLLIATRANDPQRGTWDLPGGFVDPKETAEQALRREITEETGLTIPRAHYLFSQPNTYTYSGLDIPTLDLFYHCPITTPATLAPADDVAALHFQPIGEIPIENFGFPSIRAGIRLFLEEYFLPSVAVKK
jgi:ADP-ribose pyrophosphatase YjhB (NUDIX family)